MTLGGWIFMGASWLVILALFGFSMYRTLRRRPPAEPAPEQQTSPDDADGGNNPPQDAGENPGPS
jgi:Na+/melibiose symporter-like transporter